MFKSTTASPSVEMTNQNIASSNDLPFSSKPGAELASRFYTDVPAAGPTGATALGGVLGE